MHSCVATTWLASLASAHPHECHVPSQQSRRRALVSASSRHPQGSFVRARRISCLSERQAPGYYYNNRVWSRTIHTKLARQLNCLPPQSQQSHEARISERPQATELQEIAVQGPLEHDGADHGMEDSAQEYLDAAAAEAAAAEAEALREAAQRFHTKSRIRPKKTKTGHIVLLRHGQSMWNKRNLFQGDVDVPLTERGVLEALSGGRMVRKIVFDVVFASRLVRARMTAFLVLTQSEHNQVPMHVRGGVSGLGKTGDKNRLQLREAALTALETAPCPMIPLYTEAELNERCYGALQGMNKQLAEAKFGREQVRQWRRSVDTRPPGGESMADVCARAEDFFVREVEPRLARGENVLVVAHGNSLRGIVKYINGFSLEECVRLQMQTAAPLMYEYVDDEYVQRDPGERARDFVTGELLDKAQGLSSPLHRFGSAKPDSFV
mmetsp:Transcript_3654/g.13120  ORF Transcript_3654/g.13120 Transcript_3654/m.13120 type:complete len:438 (+) Transcript_3654:217-1530(+)